MVNYPTSLDDDTTLYLVVDNVDDIRDFHHNALKDAVIAIETSLGITGAFSFLLVADIDDTPVDAETDAPISSNWAFDHAASPANINHLTDAQVTALHPVVTTLTHTSLTGKNDETDIKHLTDAQQTALHTIYSHPTGSGNKHVPAAGSSGQYLKWSVAGTAVWDTVTADEVSAEPAGAVGTHAALSATHGVAQIADDADLHSQSHDNADHTATYVEAAGAISAVEGEATLTLGLQVSIDGAGWLEGGTVPTGTAALKYGGYLYATRMYNAVYNDFADFWGRLPKGEIPIPGKVYIALCGKAVTIATKRADQRAIGICSDTYGFASGQSTGDVPLGVAGFVLAFVDNEYKVGTRLVNDKEGNLTKARFWEYPIAKFICTGEKDRCWVKVI